MAVEDGKRLDRDVREFALRQVVDEPAHMVRALRITQTRDQG